MQNFQKNQKKAHSEYKLELVKFNAKKALEAQKKAKIKYNEVLKTSKEKTKNLIHS